MLTRTVFSRIISQFKIAIFLYLFIDCSVEKPVIGLVIKFYERINQLLDTSDIIQVAKDMQKEGAFTDVNVQDIEKSKDNEAEMFFVTLESALTSKCYNLKIFGTVLKTQQKSYLLGKNILSKYGELVYTTL